jgi:hypothetical protein
MTHFYYQKIQIEIPYNSFESNFYKFCGKVPVPAIGRLHGYNSLISLGTGLVKHQLRVKKINTHMDYTI